MWPQSGWPVIWSWVYLHSDRVIGQLSHAYACIHCNCIKALSSVWVVALGCGDIALHVVCLFCKRLKRLRKTSLWLVNFKNSHHILASRTGCTFDEDPVLDNRRLKLCTVESGTFFLNLATTLKSRHQTCLFTLVYPPWSLLITHPLLWLMIYCIVWFLCFILYSDLERLERQLYK